MERLTLAKTNVIILNADQTFEDKKITPEGTNLKLDKDWSPSFTPGKSVFSERDIPKWQFWRKERKIIIKNCFKPLDANRDKKVYCESYC